MIKSRKRLFLALILGMFFAVSVFLGAMAIASKNNALANDGHIHCVCGGTLSDSQNHECTNIEWTAWDGRSDIAAEGNYYLADNVSDLTANIAISANANICLNGKTLDLARYKLTINEGIIANICDCAGEGKIISSILVNGTLNIYGGTFEAQEGSSAQYTIQIGKESKHNAALNIYGGKISSCGNITSLLNYGTTTQFGGLITCETGQIICNGATDRDVLGENEIKEGIFTLKAGEISVSNAVNYSKGFIMNQATFNVEGGLIKALCQGGSIIYNCQYGALNISGGEIIAENIENGFLINAISSYFNTTKSYSQEPIFPNQGKINISGGKIWIKDTNKESIAVNVTFNHEAFISGGTIKVDNAKGKLFGVAHKLFLSNAPTFDSVSDYIQINKYRISSQNFAKNYFGEIIANDGGKTPTYYSGENLDINIGDKPAGEVIVSGLENKEHSQKFNIITDGVMSSKYRDNQIFITAGHSHCICGLESCGEQGHTDSLYTAWDGISNITEEGYYYLANDVSSQSVTQDIEISANANICLNGKTLDLGTYGIKTNEDITTNICDCVGGGVITSSVTVKHKAVVEVNGTLNIFGGTINNINSANSNCFTVYINTNGSFNFYGGLITGGRDTIGLYNLGTTVIDGGSIDNPRSLIYNGILYSSGAANNIDTQTSTNSATLTIKSGNWDINSRTISNAGTLNIAGGKFEGKTSRAILNYCYGVTNVTGGEIIVTGNSSSSFGIAIISSSQDDYYKASHATVNISGGTMTVDDTGFTDNSYVVSLGLDEEAHISGGTLINKGKYSGFAVRASRVYLSNAPEFITYKQHIRLMGENDQSNGFVIANDGADTPTYYSGDKVVIETCASTYAIIVRGLQNEKHSEKFEALNLNSWYSLKFEYENYCMKLVPIHGHCYCGRMDCADEGHKLHGYSYFHDGNKIRFELRSETTEVYSQKCAYTQDVILYFERLDWTEDAIWCLNGHSIDLDNKLIAKNESEIMICDCVGSGKISNFTVDEGAKVSIYGGKIKNITVNSGAIITLCGGMYDQKIENAIIPEGYAWFDNADNSTKAEYPFIVAKASTISFNANGGTGQMADLTVSLGLETELTANAFSKTGYTFAGWATSIGGEKVYDDGEQVIFTQSQTLYALWTANTNTAYKIEHYFENLDGTFSIDQDKTQNLTGTSDTQISAEYLLDLIGFEKDEENLATIKDSTISADGSLVLKLYYKRTLHEVSISSNNADYGALSQTIIENVKYGTPISINGNIITVGNVQITATASAQTNTNSYYFVNFESAIIVDGNEQIIANFITKTRIDKPTADQTNYIYDGAEKTYVIADNANYIVSNNRQTDVGAYQVVVSLKDKDSYEWKDGTTDNLIFNFVIKAGEQNYVDESNPDPSKPSVIVLSEEGLSPDISLVVVDKTTDQEVISKIPMGKRDTVKKIFDISLEKNGDNVQVSEVGGKITIKILLTEDLKADNIKLYHIHGDEQGVEIKRGTAGTVNEYVIEGDYAIITIDRLSEFAFVEESASFPWGIAAIGGGIVVLAIGIVVIFGKKKKA